MIEGEGCAALACQRCAALAKTTLWLIVWSVLAGCADRSESAASRPGEPGPLDAVAPRALQRIVDGDTLVLRGERHRLFGIDAPERAAVCAGVGGQAWRCGEAAAARLTALTADIDPVCADVPGQHDRYGRHISRCFVGGQDIAERLVSEGLAWAFVRYSKEYLPAQTVARRSAAGVWQAPNPPAWEWRASRAGRGEGATGKAARGRAATPAPPRPGCDIKGNVSASGRIYHLPGSRDYAATRIAAKRGERWFCNEREARQAGWRAPRR